MAARTIHKLPLSALRAQFSWSSSPLLAWRSTTLAVHHSLLRTEDGIAWQCACHPRFTCACLPLPVHPCLPPIDAVPPRPGAGADAHLCRCPPDTLIHAASRPNELGQLMPMPTCTDAHLCRCPPDTHCPAAESAGWRIMDSMHRPQPPPQRERRPFWQCTCELHMHTQHTVPCTLPACLPACLPPPCPQLLPAGVPPHPAANTMPTWGLVPRGHMSWSRRTAAYSPPKPPPSTTTRGCAPEVDDQRAAPVEECRNRVCWFCTSACKTNHRVSVCGARRRVQWTHPVRQWRRLPPAWAGPGVAQPLRPGLAARYLRHKSMRHFQIYSCQILHFADVSKGRVPRDRVATSRPFNLPSNRPSPRRRILRHCCSPLSLICVYETWSRVPAGALPATRVCIEWSRF